MRRVRGRRRRRGRGKDGCGWRRGPVVQQGCKRRRERLLGERLRLVDAHGRRPGSVSAWDCPPTMVSHVARRCTSGLARLRLGPSSSPAATKKHTRFSTSTK